MIEGLRKLFGWSISHVVKALRKRHVCFFIFLGSCASLIVFVKFEILCTVKDHRPLVDNVCTSYEEGDVLGGMCRDLCTTGKIHHKKLSCHSLPTTDRDPVFQGSWGNITIIFKKVPKPPLKLYKIGSFKKKIYPSEDRFSYMMRAKIKIKFNLTMNVFHARSLINIKSRDKRAEMENIWTLLHSNEYLALVLYKSFKIFPKLIGTCGPLFAVQKMNSLSGYWHLFSLYDRHEEWIERVKAALKILEYLQHLEKDLPEPLHICNMKLNNFGLTDDLKRVLYLDLESVHPRSVASRITSNGSHCRKHSDCDYMNCRSFCNLLTYKCQHGVVNNNLQVACERLFLGWVSSRVMVPGLLIGPRTPRVLTEVLELCANPMGETGIPRAPAEDAIRKRLYELLLHLTY